MEIQVFGHLAEIMGSDIITIDPVPDTETLKEVIGNQYPALNNIEFVIAVNKNQVIENTSIDNSSTIVLMPPFSGG